MLSLTPRFGGQCSSLRWANGRLRVTGGVGEVAARHDSGTGFSCTLQLLYSINQLIKYRGFPYLSIYPKKKHAPKPQIRMIVRAPKQQIRMIIRVLDDSSIIRIICGPELKTRRNRNFPHIQRSFPRTFRCVSSEKSAPKSPFCVWLSSAFRWFLSGRKSRNPIDNTCPKMRNPIV